LNTQELVRDKYANYVLQKILDMKDLEVNSQIGKELTPPLVELSKFAKIDCFIVTNEEIRKFSSNVIEKCLQYSEREVINGMVKEMLKFDCYFMLLIDAYGNYVVQKTLSVAEKDDKAILIAKIKPIMDDLRNKSDFGAKIYNRLIKAHPCLQVKGKVRKSTKKNKNNQNQKRGSKQNKLKKENEFFPSQESYVPQDKKDYRKKNSVYPVYESYNQPQTFFHPPSGYYNNHDSYQ